MYGGNEQVVAVNVGSAEHLALPKLTDTRKKSEYGFDEVRGRSHGNDAQREVGFLNIAYLTPSAFGLSPLPCNSTV